MEIYKMRTNSKEITIEVPACSPLHAKASRKLKSKRTLKTPDNSEASPFPPTLDECSERETERENNSKQETRNITSKDGDTIGEHVAKKRLKGPENETIHGSDIDTSKSDTLLETWLLQPESEESEDEQSSTLIELTRSHPAIVTLDPAVGEWLHRTDTHCDRTIQDLLTPDQAFDWSRDHTTFTGTREQLLVTPGPTFTVKDRALDVFLKFFDTDLLDLIVEQTNKHATYVIDQCLTTQNSRLAFWKSTDREEVMTFLAILILQGLAPLALEKDYWRDNGYLTFKYFKDLMTYNRFVLLKRLLHFTDSRDEGLASSERKLRNIQPVLNRLNRKFSELYVPTQNVVVDETLLKWNGRLPFGQKVAAAAKGGVESYELYEAATGYLWQFSVYTGQGETGKGADKETDKETHKRTDKETNKVTDKETTKKIDKDTDTEKKKETNKETDKETNKEADKDSNQTDHNTDLQEARTYKDIPPASTSSLLPNSTAIIPDLIRPLLNLGYTVIMDSFHNSPLLARYLKTNKTDCFGTLRVGRQFVPVSIKDSPKSERDEITQAFTKDLSLTMCHDANLCLISTYHEGEIGILDYNTAMGGLDKHQTLSHRVERSRATAWHKKVFRRILNVTVHNAHVIFKTGNNISHRGFRQSLCDEIIKAYRPQLERPLVTSSEIPGGKARRVIQGNHFIGQGVSKNARCVWCRRSRSKYVCKQCAVTLCLEVCFEEYHTKL